MPTCDHVNPHLDCQMAVWEDSENQKCIFHSYDPEKPQGKFESLLKKQLQGETENDRFNFSGYIFPGKRKTWNFGKIVEDTLGRRTIEEEVGFIWTEFEGIVNFSDLTFASNSYFNGAVFHSAAKFNETTFEFANFENSIFEGPSYFNKTQLERVIFDEATFQSRVLFRQTSFEGSVSFEDTKFPNPRYGEEAYRKARLAYERRGARDEADKYFRKEMIMKRKQIKPLTLQRAPPPSDVTILKEKVGPKEWIRWLDIKGWGKYIILKPIWFLVDATTGYGTSWLRLLITWTVVICGFGAGYWCFPESTKILGEAGKATNMTEQIVENFYFSIVTFTTLGYGDIKPLGWIWQLVAGFESLLGGILIAAFVLVLGRKFMR